MRAYPAVGCDGVRSAARPAIGRQLWGDLAHRAQGMMDVRAVSAVAAFFVEFMRDRRGRDRADYDRHV